LNPFLVEFLNLWQAVKSLVLFVFFESADPVGEGGEVVDVMQKGFFLLFLGLLVKEEAEFLLIREWVDRFKGRGGINDRGFGE